MTKRQTNPFWAPTGQLIKIHKLMRKKKKKKTDKLIKSTDTDLLVSSVSYRSSARFSPGQMAVPA